MKLYLETKDYAVSQEEFQLLHNQEWDMLVTQPLPDSLDRYYESDIYISHTDARKSLTDKIYQTVKKYSIGRKLKLAERYADTKKSILDFGAGTGDFLLAAKTNKWLAKGIEPNYKARELSKAKGIKLQSHIDLLEDEKFQLITLWHVLEHLPDLEEQISKVISRLADSGTLIIAVPNFRSYDARYYGKFWAAYDVPRHLWHFSRTAMEKLFIKHKLKIVETKPMIFDAFYVSLLSEKYRTGKNNFVKAFGVGLWSNMQALWSKEYSSLIYVLKWDENSF